MLFNQKLLNKVQMFHSNEWLGSKSGSTPYDRIEVVFEGEKNFLGFKYHGTWTKTYNFQYTYTGTEDGARMFKKNPDFNELSEQLSNFLSGQRIEISKENYDFFVKEYPDRFV